MWNGTKNLMSNSKTGQMPRLLLQVVFKEENFHLGELDKRIRFISDKNDEEIRDIKDGQLDITELVESLKLYKDTIDHIKFKVDERLTMILHDKKVSLKEALSEFDLRELSF